MGRKRLLSITLDHIKASQMLHPVPFVDFPAQYKEEKSEIAEIVDRVFSRGEFIGGTEVESLEKDLAAYLGVRDVIALNSGTDALILAMAGLGIGAGDEVITPPNSFVASTAAIVHLGAQPVFADVGDDQNIDVADIRRKITPRTKAIMPVHLTGRMCRMDEIMALAREFNLKVIEDAAQSIGSRYRGRLSGTIGDAGCFSCHPLKNLNAAGDSGFVSTNDPALASWIRLARNHGLKDRNTVVRFGFVSRMDALQAAILRMRLSKLDAVIERRRQNAAIYREHIKTNHVQVPVCEKDEFNSFHLFVIQADRRDELQRHLGEHGIGSSIHYPIPIHLQPAATGLGHGPGSLPVSERQSGRILSLPIHQFASGRQIEGVARTINEFFGA